jgi:hypothetical protein
MAAAIKRFLRILGKVTLWSLGGLVVYLVFSNVEKETAIWIAIFLVLCAVNYEIQTIKERLNALQWTLDDLRRGREPYENI